MVERDGAGGVCYDMEEGSGGIRGVRNGRWWACSLIVGGWLLRLTCTENVLGWQLKVRLKGRRQQCGTGRVRRRGAAS